MRIRNRLALGASLSLMAGSLVIAACSGDDDDTTPSSDAGADATRADTGTADTGTGDTGTHDTGTPDAAPDSGGAPVNVLYTMSNNPATGANSIYAYTRGSDGSLTPIIGSPFATLGTGIGNPEQMLGPEDTDYQLIASPDHKHLYAANGGSDNVSVFDINSDGTLTAVSGSPFASGGISPVSLAFAGTSYLLVTNQDRDLGRDAGTGANANYATLAVAANGALSAAPGVTAQHAGITAQGLFVNSASNVAFGPEFTFLSMGTIPGLRSFTIGSNGALTKSAGDPYSIPSDDAGPDGSVEADQLILGMAINPTVNVMYVNFIIRGEVSAYTFDSTGALTFQSSAKVSGGAPCWIRVSKDGKYVYVTDTAFDQVSVLTVSGSGLNLTETQIFPVSNAGPVLDSGPNMGHTASEAYDEEISPDGQYLYLESERLTSDPSYTEGNMIHVLKIDPGTGQLSETSTTQLDPNAGVPITARTEGLVVF